MSRKVRALIINGNKAIVPLTQGYSAIIDACDAPLIGQNNWRAQKTKWAVYAIRTKVGADGKKKRIAMHNVIASPSAGFEVDHINHDGLDNTRENLRVCSSSQNKMNRRLGANNTSGYKGVSWNAKNGKWQAHIGINGAQERIGFYDSPVEAHSAYCAEAERLHKEYACVL